VIRGATGVWRLFAALAVVGLLVLAGPVIAQAHASFQVGAAVGDYTPPPFGALPNDAANCTGNQLFTGARAWSFMEPYSDQDGNGQWDFGESFLDCNANERWDGNFIGGGSDTPRLYTHVLDPVTARAFVVSNGQKTIAVEVLDHEGLFNVYIQRIRAKVAADGYNLDDIFISSTHDESAPDSLGLYGPNDPSGTLPASSSVNDYWTDYLIQKSAEAIEQAYDNRQPATIRYASALEPENLLQCWSSYPFVDDQRMPVLQAVDQNDNAIVTLANISQHTESVGFNGHTAPPDEKLGITADWPHFFRSSLEQTYGGVAIEMAGPVGSVETPKVFSEAVSRVPEEFKSASHPAGCRTIFKEKPPQVPLGYNLETKTLGEQLAGAVEQALGSAETSQSDEIWGARSDVCMPLTNAIFVAGATAGIFAHRPAYTGANCEVEVPPAPNGSVSGSALKTQVAAFRIGDGEFISLPGEVFPFTYYRSFLGPDDMPFSQYPLPDWPLPHMHTPYRFLDGLGEDMIGYIFPRGNGVGVPGEDPNNPAADGTDRFGCGHSDDSEAASSQAGDILAGPLIDILDQHGQAEQVVTGRYVLPDGSFSRDPLGRPVIKCDVDQTYQPTGAARGVFIPNPSRFVYPSTWMALDGRPQQTPDRNTRGYFDDNGNRVWLDVFPDIQIPPLYYARPRSATPTTVKLVPAYKPCENGNGSHGAPLSAPSCSPPVQASDYLTVGSPDANGKPAQSSGMLLLKAALDEFNVADAQISASISDVRNRTGLTDYTGELQAVLGLRITDRYNGPEFDEPATVTDTDIPVNIPCAATPGPEGGSCSVQTSINSLMPGAVLHGNRTIWQLGQVSVYDGGADGDADTTDNSLFEVQGTFAP
jgi:hypothetical protein